MINFTKKYLVLILCSLMLFSCNKDKHESPSNEVIEFKPDLTLKVNADIAGFISDESGEPLVYAEVKAGSKKATTDEFGFFRIEQANLPKQIGILEVFKSGFHKGYKSFVPNPGEETFVRVQLLQQKETGNFSAASGGNISNSEGSGLNFPSDAIINVQSNTAYSGQVNVSIRTLNSDEVKTRSFIPGDGRGTNSGGYLNALKLYGAVAVDLTSSGGQALQIATGKNVAIRIPIPSSLTASAPQSIGLWSFNDTTGLWKQEGMATRNGSSYEALVSHFSFWTVAEGFSYVNISARIVDAAGNPLVHVPVNVRFAGMQKGAGHERFSYTDADGFVSGPVFANSNFELEVLTPCATAAYTIPFSTQNSDKDLGDITGNLGQSAVTISGTAVNCENQPISNGYVQVYDGGFYNRIPIVNGQFSFTGLACTNTEVSIVTIDEVNKQQNQPVSLTLQPGINNLGNTTVCGTSTVGVIEYTIDGQSFTIVEPTDTIGGYMLPNGGTQILVLSGNPNIEQKMAFQLSGGYEVGSAQRVSDIFSTSFPGDRANWPVPVTVNITEYGKSGGFIGGNFTGKFINVANNGIHDFSCTFRVRRRN